MGYSNMRSKSDTTGKKMKQQNDETTKAVVFTHVSFSMNDYWPNDSLKMITTKKLVNPAEFLSLIKI